MTPLLAKHAPPVQLAFVSQSASTLQALATGATASSERNWTLQPATPPRTRAREAAISARFMAPPRRRRRHPRRYSKCSW